MDRRRFLTGMAGILAAGYSASVLPSGVIMPVKKLILPALQPDGSILFDGGDNYAGADSYTLNSPMTIYMPVFIPRGNRALVYEYISRQVNWVEVKQPSP